MHFINSTCGSPMRQLDIILELWPPINHDLPFAELDTLYTFILSCANNVDLVLCILGMSDLLQNHYGDLLDHIETIEAVLCLEKGDVRIYLSPLNSLLELDMNQNNSNCYIRFHHSSFMDFLHAPEWSAGYCIDTQKSHTLIMQETLQVSTSNGMCPQFSVNSVSFA